MTIDPVILLSEELRSVELALDQAARLSKREPREEHVELLNMLLARSKRIFGELLKAKPTSALGAAELVSMVARRLPFAYSRYISHLGDIAGRLREGSRVHSDLIWMRALQAALAEGLLGAEGLKMAPLLGHAVIGAARPVPIFRAVQPPASAPWRTILSIQERPPRLSP